MRSTDPGPDRTLPLRTLAAGALFGLSGVATAAAATSILAAIARPAFVRFLRPVGFDATVTPPAFLTAPPWLAFVAAALATIALPFLFNRRWACRRLWSRAGVAKAAVVLGAMALVQALETRSTGIFASVSGTAASPGDAPLLSPELLLSGLATALFFCVAGEDALGGEPDRWGLPPGGARAVLRASILGLLAGVGLALLGHRVAREIDLLFRALFAFLGESGEVSRLGWERLGRGLLVALGLSGATSGALLVALSPTPASVARRCVAAAIACVPALLLAWAGLSFERWCMGEGEMRFATLAEAAGLEPPPPAQALVFPESGAPRALAYEMVAEAMGTYSNEQIGATPGNAARLRAYLERRGPRWTAHTARAVTGLYAIHDRLLEPDQAVRVQLEAAERRHVLLPAQLLAARLPHMPPTDAVREVARALLDPARFRDSDKKRLEPLRASVTAPASGTLSGQVLVDGAPRTGLRVALYRAVGVPTALRLLAATTTGADGRFKFTQLGARAYALAVLVPASAPDVSAQGNLGPFELVRGSEAIDAGRIALTLRRR